MKRTSFNILIDTIAFVALVFLTSTGFLMRYQLPPGSGGLHSTSVGHGAETKSVSILWGLSRHEWGDIHYWISVTMMAVLAVHLLLHWKWIVHVMRHRQNQETSGPRFAVGVFGLVAVLMLACAPLLGTVERVPRGEARATSDVEQEGELQGYMTLSEVCDISGVPKEHLLNQLGLPTETSSDEKAGRLMRANNLQMQDLRQVITKYQETQ